MSKITKDQIEPVSVLCSAFVIHTFLESLNEAIRDLPDDFRATKLAHAHMEKVFSAEWNKAQTKYVKAEK